MNEWEVNDSHAHLYDGIEKGTTRKLIDGMDMSVVVAGVINATYAQLMKTQHVFPFALENHNKNYRVKLPCPRSFGS